MYVNLMLSFTHRKYSSTSFPLSSLSHVITLITLLHHIYITCHFYYNTFTFIIIYWFIHSLGRVMWNFSFTHSFFFLIVIKWNKISFLHLKHNHRRWPFLPVAMPLNSFHFFLPHTITIYFFSSTKLISFLFKMWHFWNLSNYLPYFSINIGLVLRN
jgi:hypothetical protein